MSRPYLLYILHCSDGSYYIGTTDDLPKRLACHRSARGPRYTSLRLPVFLVYSEPHSSISSARLRERQLKGWSRAKKEALLRRDLDALRELSKARK